MATTSSNLVHIKYKTDLHLGHFKLAKCNSESLIFIPEFNLCMLNKKTTYMTKKRYEMIFITSVYSTHSTINNYKLYQAIL